MGAGSPSNSGYKEYVAGLLPGVATVVTGHPFDTVKVKLQTQNTDANVIKYKGSLHCTARILQTEGIRGLYRGATPSFIGMAFESSLLFGIYSQTKLALQGGVQSSVPQLQAIIPSAAYAGAIISFVLCPSELLKCRMQIQGSDALIPKSIRFSSPLDCALKTFRDEGVAGIFRGGSTTLVRESVGNAVFFSVYEYMRYHMHSRINSASDNSINLTGMGIGILSGGVSGVAFWLAVLPLDVAKTIIQTNPDKNCQRNPFQVLSSICRRAGLKGWYTGLGPTAARAFPANAAAIVTWELAVNLLGLKHG